MQPKSDLEQALKEAGVASDTFITLKHGETRLFPRRTSDPREGASVGANGDKPPSQFAGQETVFNSFDMPKEKASGQTGEKSHADSGDRFHADAGDISNTDFGDHGSTVDKSNADTGRKLYAETNVDQGELPFHMHACHQCAWN